MSLCYDFSKWTMISLASIAISLSVGLVLLSMQFAQGQEDNQTVRTESDFYLEGHIDSRKAINSINATGQNTLQDTMSETAEILSSAAGTPDTGLNITKLEFRGDALKSICPSGKCRIKPINESKSHSDRLSAYIAGYFSEPTLDDATIEYNVHFKVKDA